MPNLGKKVEIQKFTEDNPPQPRETGYIARVAQAVGCSHGYAAVVLNRMGYSYLEGIPGVTPTAPVETPPETPDPPAPAAPPKPPPLSEQILNERKLAAMRGQLVILNRKNQELMREANAQEKIIDMASMALNALPPTEIPPVPIPVDSKPDLESVVLLASCWHIGEVVRKEEMGGLNEYNFDVFCRRFQRLVDKTISFTTQNMRAHQFDELRIFFTGDMVSGTIHDELNETNQLNIIEQATLGALVTAQGIRDLAQHFPNVICTCVVGNHGRIKKEKYYKGKWVNWDTIFYNYLALLLRDQKNVTFQIPQTMWAGAEVKGWKFLITHGDLIKSWGSIPFYGIKRAVDAWREIEEARGSFFQYFVASHFHNKAVLQTATGESILNASLKGGDEYAIGISRYSDPVQLLFGVHKKYGKTWEIPINTKYLTPGKPRYTANPHLTLPEQLPEA